MSLDVFSATVDAARFLFADVVSKAVAPLTKTVDDARTTLSDLTFAVVNGIDRQIASAKDVVAQTEARLTSEVDRQIAASNELLGSLTDSVKEKIDASLEQGNATVLGLGAKLGTLTETALETLRVSLEESSQKATDALANIPIPLATALSTAFGIDNHAAAEELSVRLDAVVRRMESNPEIPDDVKALTAPGALPSLAGLSGFMSLAGGIVLSNVITSLLQPVLRRAVYEEERLVRSNLPTASEVLTAQIRMLITPEQAKDKLDKLGYQDEDQLLLRHLSDQVLDVATSIAAWRRGQLDKASVLSNLARQGFIGSAADSLIIASEQLLDPNTLQEMLRRGFVTSEEFSTAAQSQGYSVQASQRLAFTARTLVDGGTALKSWQRGFLSDSGLVSALAKLGIAAEDVPVLQSAIKTLVDPGTEIALWLRGETSDGEIDSRLKALGYDVSGIRAIKTASLQLPSVQDLVTMAVREVFTPEIATKFGQYEDFPPEFVKQARRIGISEDVARWYWAAHWELPSSEQGFEMFQRGVIDQETLNLLIRSRDVMPFWRDKLTQIAYNPLTRVDVRRMHKLKLLTRLEVVRAYQDMGYSVINAERLTLFTEKLNEGELKAERQVQRDLSKTEYTSALKDGLLTDGQFLDGMGVLGYDNVEAQFILALERFRQKITLHKNDIALVKLKVRKGHLTMNGAVIELGKLGLADQETSEALTDIQIALENNVVEPTRTELDAFAKAGIIDQKRYVEELTRIGYSEEWANNYAQLIGAKITSAKKPTKK
ncbi:MAG: hypothetical protein Q7N50_04025 [Armatimonadota bacterium]|nr:hypothetical protein [Armatimonadota bacterium]